MVMAASGLWCAGVFRLPRVWPSLRQDHVQGWALDLQEVRWGLFRHGERQAVLSFDGPIPEDQGKAVGMEAWG